MNTRLFGAAFVATLFSASMAHAAEAPTIEEVWEIVQRQQAQIESLQAELADARQGIATAQAQVEETEQRVEATGDVLETLVVDSAGPNRTSIGGYGELHYNQISADSGDSDEIDFHRFVLFFGHEFNDRIRFFSELELEHSLSGDGKPGEVELEQAYVEYRLRNNTYARTGLFLLPIGILNETHEPPTFYGVERNDVENIIIPSTWWEAGAGVRGNLAGGFSWDASVHSGLEIPTTGSSAFRVRSGRQKVAEAVASDLAATLRLRYSGIPGLDVAASFNYQSDPSQVPGDGLDSGRLLTAHAIYQFDRLSFRAMYANWQFEGDAVEAAGADDQTGWYLEPSFKLSKNWGIYARYEDLDAARLQDRFTQSEIGFNYWPTENVVLKMDLRRRDFSEPTLQANDFDAIDLGVGYQF